MNKQNDLKKAKLQSVIDYVKNDGICKSKKLLAYFEESNSKQCGICSSCLESKNNSLFSVHDTQIILNSLKTEALPSNKLEVISTFNRGKLISLLTNLLEKELIEITEQNTYKLKTS